MIKKLIYKILNKYDLSIRFIAVGAWNTLFGYIIFCILDTVFSYILPVRYAAYMLASVIGTIISILNAYIFHKKITFRSKVNGIVPIIKEFIRFSMTYSFTFVIGIISLPILVEIFNLNPKIAAGIITILCTIISYFGHLKFSFKKIS